MKTFFRNKVTDLFDFRETPATQLVRAASNREAIAATWKIGDAQEGDSLAAYVANVKRDVSKYYPELMEWVEDVERLLLSETDEHKKAMWMISLRQAVYRATTLSLAVKE